MIMLKRPLNALILIDESCCLRRGGVSCQHVLSACPVHMSAALPLGTAEPIFEEFRRCELASTRLSPVFRRQTSADLLPFPADRRRTIFQPIDPARDHSSRAPSM